MCNLTGKTTKIDCKSLVSRLTGQVRSSTHMGGNRVNQELTLVCCDCRRTEYNFIYVTELKFSHEKSQREVLAYHGIDCGRGRTNRLISREPNDHRRLQNRTFQSQFP